MRDPQRQNRFGSGFTVEYPDMPSFEVQPRKIVLFQGIGKHDVVHIDYPRYSSVFARAMATGTPVRITWRNDKVSGEFVGHVVKSKVPLYQAVERVTTLKCIGASFHTKNRESKIWINKTASEIAADIAKTNKLKANITPHNVRFSQQSLSGQSYWEKLNELAYKIGYAVQVVGTELHFHPIDQMIDKFMTTVPVLAYADPLGGISASYEAPTLDFIDVDLTDFDENAVQKRTEKVVSGIDPITGKSYSVKTSPATSGKSLRKSVKQALFSSVETGTVSESQQMARARAEAHAQHSRLSIPASGTAQGDPRIAPYRTVEVQGTGYADGFWVVTEAVHTLHRDGRYQVEFKCKTDGIGENKPSVTRPSSAGTVPARNLADLGTPKTATPKLQSQKPLVTPTQQGLKVTPRRWV